MTKQQRCPKRRKMSRRGEAKRPPRRQSPLLPSPPAARVPRAPVAFAGKGTLAGLAPESPFPLLPPPSASWDAAGSR